MCGSTANKAQCSSCRKQSLATRHFEFTRCGWRPLGHKRRSAWAAASAPETQVVHSRRRPCSAHSFGARHVQCGLTGRSRGAPTAWRQAPVGGTLYIFAYQGLAPHRWLPLSSNVRQHRKMARVCQQEVRLAAWAQTATRGSVASLKQSSPIFENHPRVLACSRGVHRVSIRSLLF